MTDRRTDVRFALGEGCEGEFRSTEDVVIDVVSDDGVQLVSSMPARAGEQLVLHLDPDGASDSTLQLLVLASRPVLVDGTLRHQLELQLVQDAGLRAPDDHPGAEQTTHSQPTPLAAELQ